MPGVAYLRTTQTLWAGVAGYAKLGHVCWALLYWLDLDSQVTEEGVMDPFRHKRQQVIDQNAAIARASYDYFPGSMFDRLKQGVIILLYGQHHDGYMRHFLLEELDRLQTIKLRHIDIHQNDIRLRFLGHRHGFKPIARFADDFQI